MSDLTDTLTRMKIFPLEREAVNRGFSEHRTLRAEPELATAKEPNLPEEAQQHFEKQLQEKLAPLGYQVRVEYEQSELR